MSEYKRPIESLDGKFLTGHKVFDDIVHLNYGTSILMLDETFSEAYKLLHILFNNYGDKNVGSHCEVLPHSSSALAEHKPEEIVYVGDQSLSDISIEVNSFRQKFNGRPIIHTALPDMLMQNKPDDVLRLIVAWQKNIRQNRTIEFYVLPRGTFQELERKIFSIIDGGLEIKVDHQEGRFKSVFKPIRTCSPDNHLKEFRYKIEDGRLLIQRGDILTDEFGVFDIEEINHRISDYKANLRFQKVELGEKPQSESSVYDYWMLSQIQGNLLSDIKELFPENFDHILQKIASWQMDDVVRVVKTQEVTPSKRMEPSGITRSTKLALFLPTRLTSLLIQFRTGKTNMIPLDAFMSNGKAALAFIDMLLTKFDANNEEYMERLLEMQKRFSELSARETSIKRTRQMGENTTLNLDLRHFKKILSLTFLTGYGSKPIIKQISDKEYELIITECWACTEMNQSKPVCSSIEGTIEGICGTIFKRQSKCTETECKAIGDAACVFRIVIE